MNSFDLKTSPLFMVIMGSPGAGKGTQAEKLAENYKIPHISSGELLREVAKEDSPTGKSLKKMMDKGELAPSELIIEIMEERLSKADCKKGFIIDGFPRKKNEAIALEKILEKFGKTLGNVMEVKISREECIVRLMDRGRKDDEKDVINNRYDIYLEESDEVREYFKTKKNLYREINGERAEDFIQEEIKNILENQLK